MWARIASWIFLRWQHTPCMIWRQVWLVLATEGGRMKGIDFQDWQLLSTQMWCPNTLPSVNLWWSTYTLNQLIWRIYRLTPFSGIFCSNGRIGQLQQNKHTRNHLCLPQESCTAGNKFKEARKKIHWESLFDNNILHRCVLQLYFNQSEEVEHYCTYQAMELSGVVFT